MNKQRRKEISCVVKGIQSVIEDILKEEEYAYDNIPVGLQNSMIGMDSEEAQEGLSSAIESLEDAIMYLEDII